MRRAVVGALVLVLAACGRLSEAEVADLRREADAKTTRSLAQARARVVKAHGLTELNLIPGLADNLDGGVHAMGEGGGPPIVYVHPSCANGQSCDCDETPILIGTTSDGGAVVVRFVADDHSREVELAGVCGVGCGVPQPPRPPSVFELPVASPAQVRVIDEHYDVYGIAVRCEKTVYAP